MEYTQSGRPLSVATPAGSDVLLLERISGQDGVSTLFQYELEMVSKNDSLQASDLIRQKATVTMQLQSGQRYINGYISRFVQLGRAEGLTTYHATLVPWLWNLTLWADCRIFQNKTTPQIVQQVFSDNGFQDFTLSLIKTYQPREYCVQYRETSFDFVSRLLEEEGIYYYFQHTNGTHKMILVDDPAKIDYCPNQKSATIYPKASMPLSTDVVGDVQFEYRANTDKITLNDYNFTTPSNSLLVTVSGKYPEEVYDYPGVYPTSSQGDTVSRVRLEEQEAPLLVGIGESVCRAFTSGYKFDLKGHYRSDLNQTYFLLRLSFDMRTNSYRSQSEQVRFDYSNRFEMIPISTPYRPPRLTPKGRVLGTQPALVVGPAGEEIYTDKYGRIKVQFYWDRIGTKDQNSSCWIRVSQEWAGKNWGSIHIPRIGQEVVVDFLEGDPDRPLITGRVYNAEQMPPYALPDNMTQSGIQTRSSKGGGAANYNEIRFEDLKGSELLLIHAEKDKQVEVEHDRTETVGNDETITIGHNRTEEVKNDESITIDHDRTELVKNNESITINNNRTEVVQNDENITINGGRTELVQKSENITINQSRTEMVAQSETITIGESRTVEIGESETVTIGESQTMTIGESQTATIGESQTVTVGESVTIMAGEEITLMAGENIISLGPSGISITSGAMITITASMIMIN